MDIYLVRICERPDGSLFVQQKPTATTNDQYIAISHVWGNPETIQTTQVDGVPWSVELSPGKRDILNILQRKDVCGQDWFWMDLFCLDQRPDATISIPEQLMAIPAIYKSSRCVKVLIESPVCEDWQATAMRVFSESAIDQELFEEEEMRHARRCPNMVFCDPWFERLWTRQEGLYGMKIEIVTLNRVACTRLEKESRSSVTRWIAEGDALAQRTVAQFFIDDKLSYHGIADEQREKICFGVYFDLAYRHRIVMEWYGGSAGPHAGYSPIAEAWRSGRVTTKARDYVLAVFPDISGYVVPPNPRKMSFHDLLADALGQVAFRERFWLTAKFPKGMLAATSSMDSVSPWIPEQPSHVGEALDGFLGRFLENPRTTSDAKFFSIAAGIELERISPAKDTFSQILQMWKTKTDTVRHAAQVYPGGPCTAVRRTDIRTDEGLLHQYFAEKFAAAAVEAHLPETAYARLTPATSGVLTFDRLQEIPDEVFSLELRRFLVCLLCGTTLRTADIVLESAAFVKIPTDFGKLLAVVNSDTVDTAKLGDVSLIGNTSWSLSGFMIAVRKASGSIHLVGRTIIPKAEFWDTVKPSGYVVFNFRTSNTDTSRCML